MNHTELDNILRDKVAEVVFIKKTNGRIRRMLCTKSFDLLNSPFGRAHLGYYVPQTEPKYDTEGHNNLIVWDIERRDFRTVSCDTAKITNVLSIEAFKESILERL